MKDIIDLNKRAWDKIADKYDDRKGQGLSELFKNFTVLIPENARVLDLGCGTGIPHAKYMVEQGFNVTGIDLSGEMVKVAMLNVPEASFIELSMNEIEYEEKFHGIISNFSMLLLSPKLFMETAERVYSALVHGGYIYLSLNEPTNPSVDSDSDVFVNIMGQEMYSRAYTVKEVEMVFLPLGFKVVEFNRMVHVSPEFGKEHVIEFIFQKKG